MFTLGRSILTLAFEPFKMLESINFGCKPNYSTGMLNTAVFLDEDKVGANRNRDKQLIYGT